MSENAFLPEGYKAPVSGGYTKIQQGDNQMRILSSPLMVWVIWVNGKSIRLPYDPDNKPALPEGDNPSVKHAWLLIVYNYATSAIEVFELDKMTLINPLLTYANDPDWGHPKGYDIVIKKTGSGREGTKYSLIAKPAKPVSDEVKAAYIDTPIALGEMLKENGNPFISTPATAPVKKAEAAPVKKAEVEVESNDAPPF